MRFYLGGLMIYFRFWFGVRVSCIKDVYIRPWWRKCKFSLTSWFPGCMFCRHIYTPLVAPLHFYRMYIYILGTQRVKELSVDIFRDWSFQQSTKSRKKKQNLRYKGIMPWMIWHRITLVSSTKMWAFVKKTMFEKQNKM